MTEMTKEQKDEMLKLVFIVWCTLNTIGLALLATFVLSF